MAKITIDALPPAVGLDGTEFVPIAKNTGAGYVTEKTTVGAVANGAVKASYVVADNAFVLPEARVLSPEVGKTTVTDNGPGSTLVVGLADSGVTAGEYGDGSNVPQITVDANGRVTSASTAPISGFVPNSRLINAGAGLTGGGPLSSDVTIGLNSASIASLALADSAMQQGANLSDVSDLGAAQDNIQSGATFLSVSAASAAVIPARNKRLQTQFYAPNFVVPATLVGAGTYIRKSLAALTGYPASAYFRSQDRFLPNGSVDAINGGYWVLSGNIILPEMFGAVVDAAITDNIGPLTDTITYCQILSLPIYTTPAAVYYVLSGTLTVPENQVLYTFDGSDILASGSGTVSRLGVTIASRPMGGSQVRGLQIIIGQATGGSSSASQHNFNYLRIQNDQLDGTLGGGTKVDGFYVNHTFGGTGTRGGRHAIEARLTLSAATESDNPDRNYAAIAGTATASINDGGASGTEKGAFFGANPVGIASTGATFLANLTGGEANVGIQTGASSKMRTGWSIVGLAYPGQGYAVDTALSVSNSGVSGAVWGNGIWFGAQNGRPAFDTTGTVLKVTDNATVANGVDFNGMTFSTDVLRASNVRVRNSQILLSASGANISLGNSAAANTPFVDFLTGAGGTPDARLIAQNGTGATGGADIRAVSANFITNICRPNADNVSTCGTSAARWSVVWAATATISTSDERLKTEFRPFNDIEREAIVACRKHIGIYQWLSAIESKGADIARLHIGVPAQKCIAEFEDRGLDPWRYAWFCRDPKVQVVQRTIVKQRQKLQSQDRVEKIVVLENGKAVQREVKTTIDVPVFEEYPIFDESGNPVMRDAYIVDDEATKKKLAELQRIARATGKKVPTDVLPVKKITQVPAIHFEPVMEDYDEIIEVEETIDGDWVYGIRYEQLILAILSISLVSSAG